MAGAFDVQTWSPTQLGAVDDEYLGRLASLYRSDRVLQGRFEAALQQQAVVGEEADARRGAPRGGSRAIVVASILATS